MDPLFQKDFLFRILCSYKDFLPRIFKRNSYLEASIPKGVPTWDPLFWKEFLPRSLYFNRNSCPEAGDNDGDGGEVNDDGDDGD